MRGPTGSGAPSLLVDKQGRQWSVAITWEVIGGQRVECVGLDIRSADPDSPQVVNSTVLRQVHEHVQAMRAQRAKKVKKLANLPGEDKATQRVRSRAQRQEVAYGGGSGTGRPTDHDMWRERALTMRRAYLEGRSMQTALMEEHHAGKNTALTWMKRARKWDQETGAGLLDDVGRPGRPGRANSKATTKGKKK